MKKTLTTELFMTILFVVLGVLGFYFLSGSVQAWILPLFTAMILLAYLVRWQFIVTAGILMPLLTALITINNGFSLTNVLIEVVTLTATGLLVCFAYQYWKWGTHPSLVFGIVCGRLLGGVAAWILSALLSMGSFSNLYSYTVNALAGDVKGIAMQLAVVPLLVSLVFQRIYKTGKKR